MKNLFEFAGHELSQDALLRYIIENFDDEHISLVTRKLLKRLCKLEDGETISQVKCWTQWEKIDLSFLIETSKRRIELYIEDKTFSYEHDQLERYNEKIGRWKEHDASNTYKIYFKSYLIEQWEIDKAKENGWDYIDLNDISKLFEEFINNDNLIVSMYSQYVLKLNNACKNNDIPLSNYSKINMAMWESFLKNVLVKELENSGYGDKIEMRVYTARQYGYVYFNCWSKETIDRIGAWKNVPKLEIRSRDCLEGNFRALILTYEIESIDFFNKHYANVTNAIKNNSVFEAKYIRKKFPKTIAQSIFNKQEGMLSKEQFISECKRTIDEYLELMKLW